MAVPELRPETRQSGKRCVHCGVRVKRSGQLKLGTKEFCPTCGGMSSGPLYCGYCGKSLNGSDLGGVADLADLNGRPITGSSGRRPGRHSRLHNLQGELRG
jgi:hypothetical protein